MRARVWGREEGAEQQVFNKNKFFVEDETKPPFVQSPISVPAKKEAFRNDALHPPNLMYGRACLKKPTQ